MPQEPRPPKLTPLGEASVFAPASPPPTAHLWLEAGVSGQDVPGRLTSGLRPLRYVEEWLPQDAALHAAELRLKAKGLAARRPLCFQAEERSLPAQRETLAMLLDYLPKRHPELYRVSGTGDSAVVTVTSIGESFAVADWAHAPLELCNRIVQEDLVLMRRADEPTTAPHGGARHVMTAASVVFSFGASPRIHAHPCASTHIRAAAAGERTPARAAQAIWTRSWAHRWRRSTRRCPASRRS